MCVLKKIILTLCLFPISLFSQTLAFKYEKTTSFFPQIKVLNNLNTEWGYLTVPENWDNPTGKKIKIAVTILKSASKKENSNPVLFIEGGPGAGGINAIWNFVEHPLRENSDIVLVDVRGTGFSNPRFCPDLGKKFFEILAKNNTVSEDEQQKVIAAIACKQELLNNDIDIHAYNSRSIAKDLNALKKVLAFDKWNVYGVSYGTYMAQVYAASFPLDIKSLILDSPVSNILNYYSYNTSNYMHSLAKVFEACKQNPIANKQFPNLEKTYYETISKLEKEPITVKVDKKIIPTGEFTYNVEDFKVAIQQSLYNKDLIEILPLLISEFHKGNKNTLSSLVRAFSGALGLDYGMYYCVTCDEVIPHNSIITFKKDALQYEKLKGGLSFYKSDFIVCNKWNSDQSKKNDSLSYAPNVNELSTPMLIFSGGFDPITPPSNGKELVGKFKNAFLINAPVFGHGPGFGTIGRDIANAFVNNSDQRPDDKHFVSNPVVNFVTDVTISNGVTNFANSLGEFNWLFFSPLLIAFTILLIAFGNSLYLFVKGSKSTAPNKIIRLLIILTSVLGFITIIGFVMAINAVAQHNFFVLAFGIPNEYSYLFNFQWAFVFLSAIIILYFTVNARHIANATSVFSIIFSIALIGIYFQYWGFLF